VFFWSNGRGWYSQHLLSRHYERQRTLPPGEGGKMDREKMIFETWIDKFDAEEIINNFYDDEDSHIFLSALDKFKYFEVRIFGSKKG
jgi:hypothetical protein